jgi:hypothetical protein
MSSEPDEKRARKAETVRLVVGRRERAPRSPRMERAFKRLIWRYTRPDQDDKGEMDVQE